MAQLGHPARLPIGRGPSTKIAWQLPMLILGSGLASVWIVNGGHASLAVAALAGLFFFILFLLRPDIGFLIVLFARAFTDVWVVNPERGGAVASLLSPNVGLIVLLIVGGLVVMLKRRIPILSLPGGALLVLWMLIGLVGLMHSESKLAGLYQWVRPASGIVVYALAAHLFRTPREIQRVIDVLAATLIIPAIAGFRHLATGYAFDPSFGAGRAYGTFVNPGPFGHFLVLFFSIFLCQALAQSGTRKLLALSLVGIIGILLIATYTRAAWVGALVVVLAVAVLSKRTPLLVAAVLAVLVASMVPTIAKRSADATISETSGVADRQGIWEASYSQWLAETKDDGGFVSTFLNRIAGTGPGSAESLALRGLGAAVSTHNDYLGILLAYGVFGLMAFLIISVILLFVAYRAWRESTDKVMAAVALSFLAAMLGFLVMRTTGNIFGGTSNETYLWTLAGLTVAVRRLSHERAATALPNAAQRPGPVGRQGLAVAWQGGPRNQGLTRTRYL